MALYGSDQVAFFLIGGYNLLGALTEFSDKREALTEEKTVLGDSWVTHAYTGLRRFELAQSGFYDGDSATDFSAHRALWNGIVGTSAGRVISYGVEGNVSGKNVVLAEAAVQLDYEKLVARGELGKFKANYRGSGKVEDGKILRPLAGATASGNTTAQAIDFGASNVSGGAAYLQLTSFSSGASATGLQVDVLHSADNLTFSSWKGFTVATAAPLAQRVASTAALQRYAAVKWQGTSGTGGGAPASCTFMVALTRT